MEQKKDSPPSFPKTLAAAAAAAEEESEMSDAAISTVRIDAPPTPQCFASLPLPQRFLCAT